METVDPARNSAEDYPDAIRLQNVLVHTNVNIRLIRNFCITGKVFDVAKGSQRFLALSFRTSPFLKTEQTKKNDQKLQTSVLKLYL